MPRDYCSASLIPLCHLIHKTKFMQINKVDIFFPPVMDFISSFYRILRVLKFNIVTFVLVLKRFSNARTNLDSLMQINYVVLSFKCFVIFFLFPEGLMRNPQFTTALINQHESSFRARRLNPLCHCKITRRQPQRYHTF